MNVDTHILQSFSYMYLFNICKYDDHQYQLMENIFLSFKVNRIGIYMYEQINNIAFLYQRLLFVRKR